MVVLHDGGDGRRDHERRRRHREQRPVRQAPEQGDGHEQDAVLRQDQVDASGERPHEQAEGEEPDAAPPENVVGCAPGHQQAGRQPQQHAEQRRRPAVGAGVEGEQPARLARAVGPHVVGQQHAGEGQGPRQIDAVEAASDSRPGGRGDGLRAPIVVDAPAVWAAGYSGRWQTASTLLPSGSRTKPP